VIGGHPPAVVNVHLLQRRQFVSQPPGNGAHNLVSQNPTRPMGQPEHGRPNMNRSPSIAMGMAAPGGNFNAQARGPLPMAPPGAPPMAMHRQGPQRIQHFQDLAQRPVQPHFVPQMGHDINQFAPQRAALVNPPPQSSIGAPNHGSIAPANRNVQISSPLLRGPPGARPQLVMINGQSHSFSRASYYEC
jgi:hypothetical protein